MTPHTGAIQRIMATATLKKTDPVEIAGNLFTLANGLQKTIDDKRRPMSQNPTPKRMREYQSRKLDGDNLERGQRAMRALADAWLEGRVPPILQHLRTKDGICRLVRHGLGSNGYYDVHSTGEYADTSPEGRALQSLLEDAKTEADKADEETRRRAALLEEKENQLRFCDIPGFFPTPAPLVERMLELASIEGDMTVLEPSAGKGDIADKVAMLYPLASLNCIEPNHSLRKILELKKHCLVGHDFMRFTGVLYDRILMNPPFERGQDAEHIMHAYDLLSPGGRLVAIMSCGPFYRTDAKSAKFRKWLENLDRLQTFDNPPDAFKGVQAFRQTGVNTRMIVIDRP